MQLETIPSVLACDCGNSTIQLAIVTGETVSEPRIFRLGDLEQLGDIISQLWQQMEGPKSVVACSVNSVGLKAFEAAVSDAIGEETLVVGRELPQPMPVTIREPDSVGMDRLCAAVAAYDQLGSACVIADCGTAVTIDAVNEKGEFLGGAILPGLSMGAKALATQTAALPEVTLAQPDWTFGGDTNEAIIGGLVFGLRGALRDRIEAYATEMGAWPLVILTGGDAKLVCPDLQESELIQAIVPELILRGVAIAYYKSLVPDAE